MMDMLIILIGVLVSWMYTDVKMYHIIHFWCTLWCFYNASIKVYKYNKFLWEIQTNFNFPMKIKGYYSSEILPDIALG